MRIFNQLVFDGYINGTANLYSKSEYNSLLGLADDLMISGYTAQVSGTAPTLSVQIEQSFENASNHWMSQATSIEINAASLSTSGETLVQGRNLVGGLGGANQNPILPFVRLRISLGGTGPQGRVRLWATGRDRSLE